MLLWENLGLPLPAGMYCRFQMKKLSSLIQKHDDHPNCTDHNTRGHDWKLFKPQSKKGLQCRVHFFSQRVINYWNDLPSQVVTASSVNSFKSRLDNYWHQIGYGFSQA